MSAANIHLIVRWRCCEHIHQSLKFDECKCEISVNAGNDTYEGALEMARKSLTLD
jgi:hypothetical protein